MATTPVAHDWFSTPEETQARMRSWATERGLSYEPLGLLPPASPPFQVMRAGGWLVVAHDLDTATPRGARTAAGADALRAEAVRLARS